MIRVTEQSLQSWETHSSRCHVSTESVSETMGVCVRDARRDSRVAKDATKSFERHALASPWALLHQENSVVLGAHRPFCLKILFNDREYVWRDRQDSFFIAFSTNSKRLRERVQIRKIDSQDFHTAKTADEHQGYDRTIAIALDRFKKSIHFMWLKSRDKSMRHSHSKCSARLRMNRKDSQRVIHRNVALRAQPGWISGRRRSGNQFVKAIAIQNVDRVQPSVDGTWCRVSTFFLVNKVDQHFKIDPFQWRYGLLPAFGESKEYNEVKGISPDRTTRKPACEVKLKKRFDTFGDSRRKPIHLIKRRHVDSRDRDFMTHDFFRGPVLLRQSKTSSLHSWIRITE